MTVIDSGVIEHPAFYVVPTEACILLLGAAFGQVSLSAGQIVYAIVYPATWIALLCLLAARCSTHT